MQELGRWILAIFGIVVIVGVGALLSIKAAQNVDDDLSGEPPRSFPKSKADHPVPHDASEEDASDPVAAALAWSPNSITGLW